MGNSSSSHKSRNCRSLPTSPEVKRYIENSWKQKCKLFVFVLLASTDERNKSRKKRPEKYYVRNSGKTHEESPFGPIDVNYKLLHGGIPFFVRTLFNTLRMFAIFSVVAYQYMWECRRWFGKWIWYAANGQVQIENIPSQKHPSPNQKHVVVYGRAAHRQGGSRRWMKMKARKWQSKKPRTDSKNLNNSHKSFVHI